MKSNTAGEGEENTHPEEMGVISKRTLKEIVEEERACVSTSATTLLMSRR